MSDEPSVIFAAADGVARLTLNRPEKRNALNQSLILQLASALERADQDTNIRAVVITGAGRDFCSGADLSALEKVASASVADNAKNRQCIS